MNWDLVFWLAILNLPLYVVIGWLFFGDFQGFLQAIATLITRTKVSHVLSGEAGERQIDAMTLVLFLISCAAFVTGEYKFLVWMFPSWAPAAA